MSQRNTSGGRKRAANLTLSGIVAAVVLLLAIISQLTGIDLLGLSATLTPTTAPPVGTPIVSTTSPLSVFFTSPTGSTDRSTYVNGLDVTVAADIAAAQQTVDVAAFELNSSAIANALIDAHNRGVRVRLVTDDDHGLDVEMYREYLAADEDEREDIADEMESPPDETLLDEVYDAGIPIEDDDRGALMHNKFVIIDGATVWTGSMNLTINGVYRNNNNFVRIRSSRVAQDYQTEFNEMFERHQFGPLSPANTPFPQVTVNGVPLEVYFAPEDDVLPRILEEVAAAQHSIRFMTFSFTLDDLGDAMLARAADGVTVQGIFDELNSGGYTYSEIVPLFCAGQDVRWDGNRFILHHKVIIIDNETVLIGSFNFSNSATRDNDENLMIIHDPGVTAQFIAEFDARYAEATVPTDVPCG